MRTLLTIGSFVCLLASAIGAPNVHSTARLPFAVSSQQGVVAAIHGSNRMALESWVVLVPKVVKATAKAQGDGDRDADDPVVVGDGDHDGDDGVGSGSVPKPASTTALRRPSGGGGSVQQLINQVFGPYAGAATRVAQCESGLHPNAVNRASGASGVFQFLSSTWIGTPYRGSSRFNAWANVHAAYWLFSRDGHTWREWSCGYRA